MKSDLNPDIIYEQYKGGKLDIYSAVNQLMSFIEDDKNEMNRVKAVEFMGKIELKNQNIFKFLENLLVSDSNDSIRTIATHIILKNYFDKGLDAIKWALNYENSPKCLSLILKFLLEKEPDFIHSFLINELENIRKNKPKFKNYFELDFLPGNDDLLVEIFVNCKFFLWLRQHFGIILEDYRTRDNKVVKLTLHSLEVKKISDIPGLDYFTELEELGLNYTNIDKIDNLERFPKLQCLDIGKSEIKEIKGLENAHDLKKLYLNDNRIKEIKGLENLKELEVLNLNQNQISEIEDLDSLIKLKIFILGFNHIKEIKGLGNLKNLEILSLDYNQITEIKNLDSLLNLKKLFLGVNSIRTIKGLEKLINLEVLDLSHNQIESIKSLDNLKKLEYLNLLGNNLNKKEIQEKFPKIKTLFV